MAEHRWTDPETHLPCVARDEPSGEMAGPLVFRAFGVAGIAGRELLHLAQENERIERESLVESNAFQDDLAALLRAAGLPDYARPASPHQVVQEELLPEVQRLAARERVLAERVTLLETEIGGQSETERKLREGLGNLLSAVGYRDGEIFINWNNLPDAVRAARALLKEE